MIFLSKLKGTDCLIHSNSFGIYRDIVLCLIYVQTYDSLKTCVFPQLLKLPFLGT